MKSIALTLCTLALVAFSAGTALADPTAAPNATTANVTCGQDTFTVVVMGNGGFTAAHDINSTRVFVPVWFSETTVSASDGTAETYPENSKGSAAPNGHPLIVCSWTSAGEVFEGVTYTASGTVKGFFA